MRTLPTTAVRRGGTALALTVALLLPVSPPTVWAETEAPAPTLDDAGQASELGDCIDAVTTAVGPTAERDEVATACQQALTDGQEPVWVSAVRHLQALDALDGSAEVTGAEVEASATPDEATPRATDDDLRERARLKDRTARQRAGGELPEPTVPSSRSTAVSSPQVREDGSSVDATDDGAELESDRPLFDVTRMTQIANIGSITGTVTEQGSGTLLQDICVDAYTTDFAEFAVDTTASDGTYSLTSLADGEWIVSFIDCSGVGYLTEYWEEAEDEAAATPVVVSGGTVTGIDAMLTTGGSVSGTVVADDSGLPLPDVCVEVTDGATGAFGSTSTDAQGDYTVSGLRSGDYEVYFTDCGGGGYLPEYYDDATYAGRTLVAVAAGADTPGIDASLAPGGAISGTVTADGSGAPLLDICVDAYTDDSSSYGSAFTAGDGTYLIDGLAPGPHIVQFYDCSGAGYIAEYYDDALQYGDATPVSVTSGTTTTGISASLAVGGSISGTVIDDATAEPLLDICVWASAPGYASFGEATTAVDGTYQIDGLAPVPHVVEFYDCSGTGYVTEYYDDTLDYSSATPVAVASGSTTTGIDAGLGLTGSISGTVTEDVTGTPLADICVEGILGDGLAYVFGTTDAAGSYVMADAPAGTYRVQFYDCSGSGYVSEWYDDTDRASATDVVVVSGLDRTGIDAQMSTGGGITGTVVEDGTGAPLQDICVDAYTADYDSWGGTTTLSDGSYQILGLSPGAHYVEFYDCSGSGYANEFYDDAGFETATTIQIIGPDVVGGVDAAMGPGRSLSGTVLADDTGLPLPSVCVEAFTDRGFGYGFDLTASDGTYTLTGLGQGDYLVFFSDCSTNGYISEYFDDARDTETATRVTVGTVDVTGIDASLSPGAQISGTVTDADTAAPIEGLCVYADSDDGGYGDAVTASDGTYTVRGLATGSYRVEFWDCSGSGYIGEFYDDATFDTATPVEVTAPNETSGIDAALSLGGSIEGTVTASGVPVSEVCVDVSNGDTASFTSTLVDGTYRVDGLPAGDYRVYFSDCFGGGLTAEWYDDSPTEAGATLVSVTPGAVATGIDAVLAGGGSISGTVTADADGALLADICVTAEAVTSFHFRETRTAADGTYVLPGLNEDDHVLQFVDCAANGPRYAPEYFDDVTDPGSATTVFVTDGGAVTGVDAGLAMLGSISGTITDDVTGAPLEGICVDVYPLTSGSYGFAVTASDGTYTVAGLLADDYTVQFSDCSTGVYSGEFYDDVTSFEAATPVPVLDGADTPGIDAALRSDANSISGTVTAVGGGALPGICVSAFEDGGFGFVEAVTGPDGAYALVDVADGAWRISFDDCSATPEHITEWYDDRPDFTSADPVVVAGASVTGIDAALTLGGAITGSVTAADGGAPLGDVCVYGGPVGSPGYERFSQTAADGTYRLGGLGTTGDYTVYAFDCGDGKLLGQFYDGADTREEATPVPVTIGTETTGIDFAMVAGGWIQGTVTADPEGGPLEDICVGVLLPDTGVVTAVGTGLSGADGTYETTALPAGSYLVRFVDCSVAADRATEFHDDVFALGSATPVTVTTGSATTIDAALARQAVGTGSITGVVETSGGAPVEGSWVTTCAPDGRCASDVTDASGAYELTGLVDGTYTVRASAPDSTLRPGSTTAGVTGGGATTAPVIVLSSLVTPPTGVSVGGTAGGTGAVPTVRFGTPFPMEVTEPPCESGAVTYTITGPNGEVVTGSLVEDPPGTWTGDIIVPFTGTSEVVIEQEGCPDTVDFNIYIDPSGTIRTPEGDPIEGATIKLYRSDTADGAFTLVPDGSSIMAPSNRSNPDLSDAEGRWGWDVTEGYYYVTAEKAGCVDPEDGVSTVVQSPTYDIPPAVTDVDLRLECEVETVSGLEFVPITPCAVFDTRNATGVWAGSLAGGEVRSFDVAGDVPADQGGGACTEPPADAVAVELNLVAVNAVSGGNLKIAASGVEPGGGVVNFAPGPNNSNALPVEVDASGKVDVHANVGSTDVRGVALGYYIDADTVAGLEFVPLAPCAVFDTRFATDTGLAGPRTSSATTTFQVTGTIPGGQGGAGCAAPPDTAAGVVLNLVALSPQGGGNLKIAPSGLEASGGVVNYGPGGNNSNALSVEVAGGAVDVSLNGADVDVRGVVLGYYVAAEGTGQEFVTVTPCAVFDTRSGTGSFGAALSNGSSVTARLTGALPAGQGDGGCDAPSALATTVSLNLVAVGAGGGGNLQAAETGVTPAGGVVNLFAGGTNSNEIPLEVDASGNADVFLNGGPTDVRGVALGYWIEGD